MRLQRMSPLVATMGIACTWGWALGGIEGSKHDFSKTPWGKDDSCGVCHTPQRSEPPKAAPLWEPGANLNRTFGTRRSPPSPGPGTTTCLRCHDGTVARETISGVGFRRAGNVLSPAVFSAAHGATDHPVGIEYPTLKNGYRSSSAVQAQGAVSLPNGMVECASCHDPHNVSGIDHMLVMENTRSALCLTCHRK